MREVPLLQTVTFETNSVFRTMPTREFESLLVIKYQCLLFSLIAIIDYDNGEIVIGHSQ